MSRLLGSPAIMGTSMVVLTILSVLSAFRITPQIPAWFAGAIVVGVTVTASLYSLGSIVLAWRRVQGVNAASFRLVPRGRRGDALARLDAMIGLDGVKGEIKAMIARIEVETARREAGMPVSPMSLHIVFTGPPGVGKTVVARLYAELLAELGVLQTGAVVETDRSGLVGGYVGQTALKTKERVREALGGVLFIDEAYALVRAGDGQADPYGQEAVDTLMKEMEDRRDAFLVIVAGYAEPMEIFLRSNPGLPSRFTRAIAFPSYGTEELLRIFHSMLQAEGLDLAGNGDGALCRFFDAARRSPDFANARTVRTLLERAREAQAIRLTVDRSLDRKSLATLTEADIDAAARRPV